MHMRENFMTEHPLREYLTNEDWKRIRAAIDSGDYDNITIDELAAANDLIIDELSSRSQTHISVFLRH